MNFSEANCSASGDAMGDFERFYLNTRNLIYGYLCHHAKDAFEVEDIVQETYLVALEQWDMVRNHPNPAGWLMKTAQYLNYNYERHVLFRKECLSDSDDIPYEEEAYDSFVMEDLLQNVYNKREQDLAKKYFLDGESISELSHDFGITEGALRMRLYRMKNRLKTYIESEPKVW